MPSGNARRHDMARLYTFPDDVRIDLRRKKMIIDDFSLGCS